MHADISRDSFDSTTHSLRVVQEQGTLLLDADANEQSAILLHRLHTLAGDLFGPFWGPAGGTAEMPLAGFKIGTWDKDKKDFPISAGRYYVSGRLCENEVPSLSFLNQLQYPLTAFPSAVDPTKPFAVYLDVWERMVSEAEVRADVERARIDPAFQTLSPAPRTELVWQVKVVHLEAAVPAEAAPAEIAKLVPVASSGMLAARVHHGADDQREGDFRGLENQLYRVEVHRGGEAYKAGEKIDPEKSYASFKWSRDNGSVAFPLKWDKNLAVWKPDPKHSRFSVPLAHPSRDDRTALKPGQWVEYVDPFTTFARDELKPGDPLLQLFEVEKVDGTTVTLQAPTPTEIKLPVLPEKVSRWAFLRRWDFTPGEAHFPKHASGFAPAASDGGLLVVSPSKGEASDKKEWLELEDGIQIRFEPGTYQVGDYWLIPARTSSADVVWPRVVEKNGKSVLVPKSIPARNAGHAYAPLAVVNPTTPLVTDCRRRPKADLTEIVS